MNTHLNSNISKAVTIESWKICWELRNKTIECARGMTLAGKKSDLVRGNRGYVKYNRPEKDILSHNHPDKTPIWAHDMYLNISEGTKKAYVSTKEGFYSVEYLNKKNYSKNHILEHLNKMINEIIKIKEDSTVKSDRIIQFVKEQNQAIAKKFGWIYSEVKWSDFKKVPTSKRSS